MKVPLLRDVPPRAAIVIVALVLAATLVTGAPWTAEQRPEEPSAALPPVSAPQLETEMEPLDLESLERRKVKGSVPDLFSPRSTSAPSPAVQAAVEVKPADSPPQAPVAPALPFRYLGRFDDGERVAVFLESGQNLYSVGVGDTFDDTYRVESISDSAVTFTYLSLGVTQSLAVTPAQ